MIKFRDKTNSKKLVFALGILIFVGMIVLMFFPRIVIPYREEVFEVVVEDDEIYLEIHDSNYRDVAMIESTDVVLNTQKEKVVMVYVHSTIWSEIFDLNLNDEVSRRYLGKTNEVTQIYYGNFGYDNTFFDKHHVDLSDFELIWN